MKKKAIFPGTFDPFTVGHDSIVKRSLSLVDEIVIAIGINDSKKNYFSLENRVDMIQSLYENDDRVCVKTYDTLTVDYAKEIGANFIVRGIRTIGDFEYEKTIADMNRNISGIETVILFTEAELTHISSTIVRELLRYNHDVSRFVPDGMNLEKYK